MKSFEQIAKSLYQAACEEEEIFAPLKWHELPEELKNVWVAVAKEALKQFTEVH